MEQHTCTREADPHLSLFIPRAKGRGDAPGHPDMNRVRKTSVFKHCFRARLAACVVLDGTLVDWNGVQVSLPACLKRCIAAAGPGLIGGAHSESNYA